MTRRVKEKQYSDYRYNNTIQRRTASFCVFRAYDLLSFPMSFINITALKYIWLYLSFSTKNHVPKNMVTTFCFYFYNNNFLWFILQMTVMVLP